MTTSAVTEAVPEVDGTALAFMQHLRLVKSDGEYLRCLIAYHAAPTLLGIKPATLFCPDASGRDLDKALGECAHCLARELGVEVAGFRNRAGALLLLVYRPELLATTLAEREVSELLREAGYEVDQNDWRTLLKTLGKKCSGVKFPHEIGVFLGYPARDVRQFMQDPNATCTCKTAWKAYGDFDGARDWTRRYQEAKACAARHIVSGEGLRGVMDGLAVLS